MPEKPTTAAGYVASQGDAVVAALLYLATKLGELMDDLVVVGGLVPSLLVDVDAAEMPIEAHVGTMDLDVGLAVALLDQGRYRSLTERLRQAGFETDENHAGNATRQRWRIDERAGSVTVDFLIAPTLDEDRGGRLRNIEPDFAAIIAPGLDLAFRDRLKVELEGRTIKGERASRSIWVCGPGAFVVLKALAFRSRGENKDAYDLFYLLKYYGGGVESVARHLEPLLDDPSTKEALEVLRRDFCEHDAVGPMRVAAFLTGGRDDTIQADVVGFVEALLVRLGR